MAKKTDPPPSAPEARFRYRYTGNQIIKVGAVNVSRNGEVSLTEAQFAALDKLFPGKLTPLGV